MGFTSFPPSYEAEKLPELQCNVDIIYQPVESSS
jgi:hypothetical protein